MTDVYKTLWGGQLCLSGKSWKLHVHILAVELDWYTLCVFWEIKCVVVVSLGVFQLSDTYCRFLSNRFFLYTELKVSGLFPVTPVILSSKRMSLFSTDVVWWNVKMGGGYFCRMKIQIFLSSSVCKEVISKEVTKWMVRMILLFWNYWDI